jgi:hypothetical protein
VWNKFKLTAAVLICDDIRMLTMIEFWQHFNAET